ncbi:MAG TPA: hypothetical protein VEU72_07610 [Nitrosopumilaceae archaeon]|nr:hypothetical protein [Nitrosopumilaceae archaeon]
MLSKTEREFLACRAVFSKRHARQYRYTIKKRVYKSLDDLRFIIENNEFVGLDLKELETELEQIVVLIGSTYILHSGKASSHTQTSTNPFSAINSGWGT